MDTIEYAVLDTIRKGGIPIGANHLSERLNIPPASVGRILSRLERQGLLEKVSNKGRQLTGKGHGFLADQDQLNSQNETVNNLIYMISDPQKDKLMDILQARILLECYTVEMACKNATEEGLLRLNGLMLEYIYEVRLHGIASEQNLMLHIGIAELAGNQTVLQMLRLILMNDSIYNEFSSFAQRSYKDQLIMHNNIIEAINNRDPVAAKDAMRVHLEHIGTDMREHDEPFSCG